MKQKFFGFDGFIEVAIKFDSAIDAAKLAAESLSTVAEQLGLDNEYPTQVYVNGNELHLLWDSFSWDEESVVAEYELDGYTVIEHKSFKQ
jgi:hypothetical protein|nr:MAG TPA: hypothetical protein [Caudoviricetes sp.]